MGYLRLSHHPGSRQLGPGPGYKIGSAFSHLPGICINQRPPHKINSQPLNSFSFYHCRGSPIPAPSVMQWTRPRSPPPTSDMCLVPRTLLNINSHPEGSWLQLVPLSYVSVTCLDHGNFVLFSNYLYLLMSRFHMFSVTDM